MSGLTVTEKNHWRDRIAARIDRRIETIIAADPGLMSRVQGEARGRALESLGLAEHQAELDSLAQQRAALDKRERRIRRTLLAQVRGVPVEDIEESRYFGPRDQELDSAIAKRQAVHEAQLLAEHEVGHQLLQLRFEKDNLLDVVWLATSPVQVRQLWSRVGELLGDKPTDLEREALAIKSVGDCGSTG